MSLSGHEGEITFSIPDLEKTCKTWYKVVGDLENRTKRPFVVVHGGPGFSHDYLASVADLASNYDIPVVFYDQVGGGRSTKIPEKRGDATFWTEELFMDELEIVLKHLGIQDDYDAVGHSWGGMLLSRYAAVRQPKGMKHLVLADSLASMQLWMKSARGLLKQLPQKTQDLINKHEEEGTTDSPKYQAAVTEFYSKFVCTVVPFPKDFTDTLELFEKDPTVYTTMCGTSEFNVNGSLRTWTVIPVLHKIEVTTLVLNGRYDEAQDFVVAPLFQHIPHAKWYTFANSSHMPHLEERNRWMELVSTFLSY